MTDAASAFVRRRQPESLEEMEVPAGLAQMHGLAEIEATIAQHRRATEQSTYQADMRPGGMLEVPAPAPRDALTDIAMLLAALPLRLAMEMAEAVVKLEGFKAPETKIELAIQLNTWAEERLNATPK